MKKAYYAWASQGHIRGELLANLMIAKTRPRFAARLARAKTAAHPPGVMRRGGLRPKLKEPSETRSSPAQKAPRTYRRGYFTSIEVAKGKAKRRSDGTCDEC
jgi:hypothetical protein